MAWGQFSGWEKSWFSYLLGKWRLGLMPLTSEINVIIGFVTVVAASAPLLSIPCISLMRMHLTSAFDCVSFTSYCRLSESFVTRLMVLLLGSRFLFDNKMLISIFGRTTKSKSLRSLTFLQHMWELSFSPLNATCILIFFSLSFWISFSNIVYLCVWVGVMGGHTRQ